MQWHEILCIYVIISNNVVFKENARIYLLSIAIYFGLKNNNNCTKKRKKQKELN